MFTVLLSQAQKGPVQLPACLPRLRQSWLASVAASLDLVVDQSGLSPWLSLASTEAASAHRQSLCLEKKNALRHSFQLIGRSIFEKRFKYSM